MKAFTNVEIAKILRQVAAAYAIKNEAKYRFQILAYQKAADSIESSTTEVKDMLVVDKLDKIPGIGTNISDHLIELFKEGTVKHFDTILKEIPPAVFPLLDIPTFGPKKAFKLIKAFSLQDPQTVIEDIYSLAQNNKISTLPTFGEKSQSDIIRAIDEYKLGKTKSSRMVLSFAQELANGVMSYLKKNENVLEAHTLGSLRRMKSTIGDVDIAVASSKPEKVIEHFINYPYKDRIIEKGDITASIILSGNKQVDLIVLPPDQLGSMLQHFTGSKEHNIRLREHAIKKGFSLSEKGIKLKDETQRKFNDENEFYKFLGLKWIPPEIRENQGEIEAALRHAQGLRPGLPTLIDIKDIKGDFHIHSSYPIEPSHDLGKDSMQAMVDKAKDLMYEYLGFSEHNPSISNHSEQQIYSILQRRNDFISKLRESNKSIRIFNLLEVDILADGNIALSERCMDLLDMAIVSIHSVFNTPKREMTTRILKGLSSHPKAKILAHPTGRLINNRAGYEVDWEELFEFTVKHNKALEINSWPTRLDLPDVLVKKAKESGIKFFIDTDSHAISHLSLMNFGVSVARRGWCETKDVLNTYNVKALEQWIRLR